MTRSDNVLNVILGVCGVVYSFLPPHRVPGYRQGVALALRIGGTLLLLTAVTAMVLDHQLSVGHGRLKSGHQSVRQDAGGAE